MDFQRKMNKGLWLSSWADAISITNSYIKSVKTLQEKNGNVYNAISCYFIASCVIIPHKDILSNHCVIIPHIDYQTIVLLYRIKIYYQTIVLLYRL